LVGRKCGKWENEFSNAISNVLMGFGENSRGPLKRIERKF
jgi:hypothetical protein